jgi:hypothetical protein
MPRTVIGLFDDLSTAKRAEQALTAVGVGSDHLVLASSPARHALAGEGVPVADRSQGMHGMERDVVATLESHGVPGVQAEAYAAAVRRGGAALVLYGVDDQRAEQAAEILLQHRPLDPSRRLSTFQNSGYAGYNAAANAFSSGDEVVERNRFADEHHDGFDVIYVM